MQGDCRGPVRYVLMQRDTPKSRTSSDYVSCGSHAITQADKHHGASLAKRCETADGPVRKFVMQWIRGALHRQRTHSILQAI
eukprot:scaffold455469_cov45-Prasinocladus_malaysianus.AAC.1